MKTITETAEALLAKLPAPRNPFGSDGELEHALMMVREWGEDPHVRDLVSALARVARQRGLIGGDQPFEWDEAACTHHINWQKCREMCEALRR